MNSEAALAGAPLVLRFDERARRLRLRLDRRGDGFTLTIPGSTSRRRALAWAAEQESWAVQALERRPQHVPITHHAVLPFRGEPHRIEWRPDHPRQPCVGRGVIALGGPAESVEQRLLRWLRQEASALLTRETAEIADAAGVTVDRVSVGDPVSRWGSCSTGGAIRYSWRLVMAPDFVRRATVAHEVAHRVHMNHGAEFHSLVAQLLGADPKPARLWLRQQGASLHRVGAR